MKRGLIKNRKYNSEYYLKWGISGLKISLLVIVLILAVLLYLLFLETRNLYEFYNVLFRFPDLSGFLFMYSGVILFIIVPFVTGILGLFLAVLLDEDRLAGYCIGWSVIFGLFWYFSVRYLRIHREELQKLEEK